MGFHVSWVMSLDKSPGALRTELGLRETGQRECHPESDITGMLLPSGWYLVFFNQCNPAELKAAALRELSRGARIMVFIVEETSMISVAQGYADGVRDWEVLHDAESGLRHLDVAGTPPAPFIAVRDRLLEKLSNRNGDADYLFDVPAELCKAMTGFRYDADFMGTDGDAFEVLIRA